MRLYKSLTTAIFIINITPLSYGQKSEEIDNRLLSEFELINFCHCVEYLNLRNFDYIKWKSNEAKEKHLSEIGDIIFSPYKTQKNYDQVYQDFYDNSLFLKNGISVYYGTILDYSRLDSLYYEPIVQSYVNSINKIDRLPYFGLRGKNYSVDCFYRVKEIPLKKELEYFIQMNNSK